MASSKRASGSTGYALDASDLQSKEGECKFNWFAAIFGPFWALYHKMYAAALPIFIAMLMNGNLALSLVRLCRRFTQKTDNYNILMPHIQKAMSTFLWMLGIWIVYQLIFSFIYGGYNNKLCYKYIKEKISRRHHFIRNIRANYYLKVFKQLKETGKCKFNWSAAIFGPFWALHRKMYVAALPISVAVLINANLVLSIIWFYRRFTQKTDDYNILMTHIYSAISTFLWALGIWISYQLISSFVYGKYGNRLYCRLVKKKISKGYHLSGNISSTISIQNITLILSGVLMVSSFITSFIVVALSFWGFKFSTTYFSCIVYLGIVNFCILSAGEILYYLADVIAAKKSIPTHPDLKISEENIQKYLVAKGHSIYKRIVDGIIWLGIFLYTYIMFSQVILRHFLQGK